MGDVESRLARIAQSKRSSRWKKRARQHLLRDAGAIEETAQSITLPNGHVCLKVGYKTFSTAFQALIAASGLGREEKRCYPCTLCGRWHLTSMDHTGENPHGRQTAKQAESQSH